MRKYAAKMLIAALLEKTKYSRWFFHRCDRLVPEVEMVYNSVNCCDDSRKMGNNLLKGKGSRHLDMPRTRNCIIVFPSMGSSLILHIKCEISAC